MAVTMADVRAILDPEEPDYAKGARLGPEAIPHLVKLAKGKDAMLAAKATSLAGMIGHDDALKVLTAAVRTKDPMVRAAAAGALEQHEGPKAERLLAQLVNDNEPSVRKIALRSVTLTGTEELRTALTTVEQEDGHKPLRDAAKAALKRRPR